MGWAEPRAKLRAALDSLDEPEEFNPFGADPARMASVGRQEDAPYYAPAAPLPEPDLPAAPLNAAGRAG